MICLSLGCSFVWFEVGVIEKNWLFCFWFYWGLCFFFFKNVDFLWCFLSFCWFFSFFWMVGFCSEMIFFLIVFVILFVLRLGKVKVMESLGKFVVSLYYFWVCFWWLRFVVIVGVLCMWLDCVVVFFCVFVFCVFFCCLIE